MLLEKLNQFSPETLFESVVFHPAFSAWVSRLEAKRGRGRDDYPLRSLAESLFRLVCWKFPSFRALPEPRPSPFSFSRFLASVKADLGELLLEIGQPGAIAALGGSLPNSRFLYDVETGVPFAWVEEDLFAALERIPPRSIRFLLAGSEWAPLAKDLWRRFSIRPIIPLPEGMKQTFAYKGHPYDEKGELACPGGTMMFGGFEEKRNALKYLCAARHYGTRCKDWDTCSLKKNLRIPLEENPDILTPLPRFSQRWQRLYARYEQRGAVEAAIKGRIPAWGNPSSYFKAASIMFAAALRPFFSARRRGSEERPE